MSLKNKEFKEGNLAVYVMTHGPECTWLDDYCIPMELGAVNRDNLRYATRDDEGDDNISEKNGLYNELTGLYWMWKNDNHEYVGLYHYRRICNHINKREIPSLLKKYDFIISKQTINKPNMATHYCHDHCKVDWDIMLEELNKLYPNYYNSASKVFSKRGFIPGNIFITTNKHLNEYCSWLFPLLENIENRLDISDGRTDYNKRAIGILGERLFNLYLFHNNYKLKHVQILAVPPHFPIHDICPKSIASIINSNIHLYNWTINAQKKIYKALNIIKRTTKHNK